MKFFIYSILILSLLASGCNHNIGNAGRKLKRIEESFNDNWLFLTDSASAELYSRWFEDKNLPLTCQQIQLPHTWNSIPEFQDYYGQSWYFKRFYIPGDWENSMVRLEFSAVYRDANFWVNGQLIGERIGAGYTPFCLNLQPYLHFGDSNFIAIAVTNHFSKMAIPYDHKFDWPADGGIIRNVSLVKQDFPAIDYIYIEPELKPGKHSRIAVKLGIKGHKRMGLREIDVWYQVEGNEDSQNNPLIEGNRKMEINDNSILLNLNIENIEPWHFHSPKLYEIKIAIGYQSVLSDYKTEVFGFRSLESKRDKLIFNGEPVRLPALEWMPGSNPDYGMAEDTLIMDRMLRLLKESNAVMTRFHWQQDEYILDWCDQNGLLVQMEIPLWQAPYPDQINDSLMTIIDRHVEEMVHAYRNHPSVIAWGIGNEMAGQDEEIKSLLSYLYDKIHDLDSTRLINYVSNTFHHNPVADGTTLGDVLMWNDYSGLWYDLSENGFSEDMLPGFLREINESLPDRSLIISEYGLCEPFFKGGDHRRIEHMKYHTTVYESFPDISGNIYFSLNDYRTHMGEEGEGRFKQRVHGVTDLYGHRKDSWYELRDLFSPLKNLEGNTFNNNFHVTGNNHSGLPSYTLKGFEVSLFDSAGHLVGEKILPDVSPGNKFNLVFRDLKAEVKKIEFTSPAGFCVISKEL